jgi:hypothetical protein
MSGLVYWILDGHSARQVGMAEWDRWRSTNPDRRVAVDDVAGKKVSTVFLGIDHSFGGPVPILFETMVFPAGSWADEFCDRYATWDEAAAGHAEVVRKLKMGEAL